MGLAGRLGPESGRVSGHAHDEKNLDGGEYRQGNKLEHSYSIPRHQARSGRKENGPDS
jgi:hypothetical protein